MSDADDKPLTYRDGIGVERCALCLRALRDKADEPLMAVRRADVAEAVRALASGGGDGPPPELALRLAHGLGRSVKQILAGEYLEEHGYGHGV